MTTFESLIFDAYTFNAIGFPPKRQIIKPWLTEQSITLIAGYRGTGKTWFALSLLDAISRGISFGPWETITPLKCLYLDGELPPQDIQERSRTLNPSLRPGSQLLIYSNAMRVMCKKPCASLLDDDWKAWMKAILVDNAIKLWVVDNLSALAPGIDENSKREFDPINKFFLELRFAGISTIVLHHTGKKGGQRGTSAREDVIDTSIILKKPADYSAKQGARFVLSFTKTRTATRDSHLLGDLLFQLRETPDGRAYWEYENVKSASKEQILNMLHDGALNKDIANALGVTPSYVSKIKKQAIKDGLLTDGCQLTEKGILFSEGG